MDNLFILLQKDKKIQRQFAILKNLRRKEVVSADKIATELNIHRATLMSDIEILQSILPDEITITHDFRNGYLLDYPENNSIDYYIAQIARKTLVYSIIDRLFLSVDIDIDNLAEECYSSEHVISRLIAHMNKVLKSYHISISKHQLKFIGREADIRTFLFAFYRTFMDYYTLEPIDKLYKHSYEKTIDGLKDSKLHQNKAKVFLWTVISRTRIANEYFITVEEDLQEKITSRQTYLEYREIYFINLKRLRSDFHLDGLYIPESEVIWAYLVAIDCIEYVERNEIEENKSDLYRFQKGNSQHLQLEKDLHKVMNTYFKLTEVDEVHFRVVFAYLINITLLSEISQNFQKVSMPLKRYIQNGYKETYDNWIEILQTPPFNTVVINNPEDIAATLSMLTVPIINNHLKGSLNILFSFESEAGFSAVLADSSKLMLVDGVHATYVFSSEVTPEFIAENKIDVLVANFKQRNEDQLGCVVFHLSYLPTLFEWTQLRNKIIGSLK